MSFCTQGLPGVAESTVSISGGKPSLSGKDTRQTDEGWEKVFLSGPHPLFAMVPLSRKARIIFFQDRFCDYAFGSAQNDRVGSILRRVKVFRLEKTSKRESAAMSIDFGLMLCALVLG